MHASANAGLANAELLHCFRVTGPQIKVNCVLRLFANGLDVAKRPLSQIGATKVIRRSKPSWGGLVNCLHSENLLLTLKRRTTYKDVAQ
jgi:hypothetical protein